MTAAGAILDRPVLTVRGAGTCSSLGVRAWLALLLAAQLAAMGTAAAMHWWVPSAAAEARGVHHPVWPVLILAAAIAGFWACRLATRAWLCLHHAARLTAITVSLMAVAPAIAICAIAIIASVRHPLALTAPVIVPVMANVVAADPPSRLDTVFYADDESDAQAGLTLYADSCAACHGDAGQGVENVGPPLAATEFLGKRTDEQMVGFLQTGRAPGDANSIMGRAMPARGGNMALTDRSLANIVAHLRTLTATEGEMDTGIKAATLPRWLAPPPAAPVIGVVETFNVPTWLDIEGVMRPDHEPWHVDLIVNAWFLVAVGQGMLLLTIAALLLRTLGRRGGRDTDLDLSHVATAWALVALAAIASLLAPWAGVIP